MSLNLLHVAGDEDHDGSRVSGDSSLSDTDTEDMVSEGCGSPRMQRKRRRKKLKERLGHRDSVASQRPMEELMYDENLPEVREVRDLVTAWTGNSWQKLAHHIQ